MVSITIFVEGGTLPPQNDAANTVDNSVKLTESFNKLFRGVFDEDEFSVKIELKGGEKNAASFFKKAVADGKVSTLLVDVYKQKTKEEKIAYLKLEKEQGAVFFMVREMEAWILSQLDVIQQFSELENLDRKREEQLIINHKQIKEKKIPEIDHPSKALKVIMEYFFKKKNGKKYKHGKLKHTPTMIALLDIQKLREDFEDVEKLIQYIQSKKQTI
jgi:hypothetical protein